MFGVAKDYKKTPLVKIDTMPLRSKPSAIKYDTQGHISIMEISVLMFCLAW